LHIYKFVGAYPIIASELELGPDTASIERNGNPPSFDGDVGPVGSTVVLQPGDILHSAIELDHHLLEEVLVPAKKAAAKAPEQANDTPAPPAEIPAPDAPTEPKE
jgi:hypothetical protein